MERRTTYRRTTRLIIFCGLVLLGLGWARVAPALSGWFVILVLVLSLLTFRKARIISVYAVLLAGFGLGWWRGGVYMNHVHDLHAIAKRTVTGTGTALSDAIYDKSQLSFDLGNMNMSEPYEQNLVGKVGVSGYGENMVYRGDTVEVTGKFYPGRGSVVAYMSYSKIHVTGHSHSIAYSITRRFNAGLLNTLPEPLGSFAMGLLIGQRNTLPAEVTLVLSAVGLSHIVAVSGYNLTIMMRSARRIFGKGSKFQIFVGSQALILGFLLVTGLSASIVRAAIISSLSLGAWYYGRTVKPLLLILFAAAITAFWNPLYIWSDIGWYLSFLAFFGVLIVGPLVRSRFFRHKKTGIVGDLVMETLSAQLLTLPLILYIFQTSSLIALPANILVVPLIPLAMLLSFIAGLAGMIVPAIAGWFSWPARIVLTYLLDVATWFSRIPHMSFAVSLTAYAMLTLFAVIVVFALILWRKTPKTAKITDVDALSA